MENRGKEALNFSFNQLIFIFYIKMQGRDRDKKALEKSRVTI